jgi:N-acetyl sugar amidotransferase
MSKNKIFNKELKNRKNGDPLFRNIKYCKRCCMPETNEFQEFDEMGICNACRSSEQKMKIDWNAREKKLAKIFSDAKKNSGNNYDCIVPISGGKDSCFQLHIIVKIFKLTPLAVTFSHNWWTKTGKYNLENILEKLGVDHMMYTPNRGLINKLAKKSLKMIGDSCWHCHAGVWSYPFHVATKFKIPLIIYGESPADFSGQKTYAEQKILDKNFSKEGLIHSIKVSPSEMIDKSLSEKDLNLFFPPSDKELTQAGVQGIFLGDYIFWDHERQSEFLKKEYDWREDKVEGSYKYYKSVECKMAGVHDYAKYIKRGFGRGTDFASQDVRAGLISREEGFNLAVKTDSKRPKTLDYYLKITGYSEKQFEDILISHRNKKFRNKF